MHAPHFWLDESSLAARLLTPLSLLWRIGFKLRRLARRPYRAGVPVICVGNLVAGGAGKTPVALALARLLHNKEVFFLTRGYGGKRPGPLRVDTAVHSPEQVGDEALLLASAAPTIMSKQRVAGAKLAVEQGAEVIIMDDGFQNPTLYKDLSLLVVDGAFGFGNGRIIPAGPLREPVHRGMARAQGVIIIGEDTAGVEKHVPAYLPVIRAQLATSGNYSGLAGKKVLAFAGIGRPEKFYVTLQALGCDIVEMLGYPDHYRFTQKDTDELRRRAAAQSAVLVTTSKDAVRLPADMRGEVTVIYIEISFADKSALKELLREVIT